MIRPLILDCDPGHDDALAILLAIGSPNLDLLAVTTCFGNCSIEDSTRNALQILELAGRPDIPVGRGADSALNGSQVLGNYVHGSTGLDGPALPEPQTAPVGLSACDLMADKVQESPDRVSIAVTGPMTNMAAFVRTYPELVPRIEELVFMGGSTERGNHTPTAEFNVYADPEALSCVLDAGLNIKMVGLNLTHQALATADVVRRMKEMRHPLGRLCSEWMGFFGDSYRNIWEFSAPPVHDPCTIAAFVDQNVITWQDAFVAVELDGQWTRGTTVVDLHRRFGAQNKNAQVGITLDSEKFWELMLSAIDQLGETSL